MEIKIYFEVTKFKNENIELSTPFGMCVNLGKTDKETSYTKLVESINISKILELIPFDDCIKLEDIKIISPEEYYEKYSDEE